MGRHTGNDGLSLNSRMLQELRHHQRPRSIAPTGAAALDSTYQRLAPLATNCRRIRDCAIPGSQEITLSKAGSLRESPLYSKILNLVVRMTQIEGKITQETSLGISVVDTRTLRTVRLAISSDSTVNWRFMHP